MTSSQLSAKLLLKCRSPKEPLCWFTSLARSQLQIQLEWLHPVQQYQDFRIRLPVTLHQQVLTQDPIS
jgi:hypothetical protein